MQLNTRPLHLAQCIRRLANATRKLHVQASAFGVAEMSPSRGDAKRKVLTLAGYEIEAGSVSVAGQETCISIPQLKLIFDTGRCPQRAVYQPYVFLSHSHMDHIGGLPFHVATRAMLGLPPSTVILPESMAKPTQNLLDAYGALDGSTLPCSIVPLAPGQEYKLPSNYFVKAFPTVHTVPSQGYVVYLRKQKLRPELAQLSNNEIRDRRLAGEDVTYTVVTPEVAFTGDTSAEVFSSPGFEDALAAKLLIMEATFLEDDVSQQHAKSYGHMHISEIAERADLFKNEAVLLIHFSQRYTAEAIVEHLDKALPTSLRTKCTPLLQGYS